MGVHIGVLAMISPEFDPLEQGLGWTERAMNVKGTAGTLLSAICWGISGAKSCHDLVIEGEIQ